MPTVLRIGQYRFHFYSDENSEPAHKLHEIEKLVFENINLLLEKYHEFHKN